MLISLEIYEKAVTECQLSSDNSDLQSPVERGSRTMSHEGRMEEVDQYLTSRRAGESAIMGRKRLSGHTVAAFIMGIDFQLRGEVIRCANSPQ